MHHSSPQRNRLRLLLAFALLMGLVACRKDLENVTADNWTPILALPLAQGHYTVEDLLASADSIDTLIVVEETGILALQYSGRLYSFGVDTLLDLPDLIESGDETLASLAAEIDAVPVGETIPIGPIPVFNASLNTTPAVNLDVVRLSGGSLTFELTSTIAEDYTGTLTIPELRDPEDNPVVLDLSAQEPNITEDLNLAGYALLLDGTNASNDVTGVLELSVTNTASPSSAQDGINYNLTFTDLTFERVTGDFSNLTFDLVRDTVELNIFNNSVFVEDFQLAEAFIELTTTNTFGVPFTATLDPVESENLENGQVIELDPPVSLALEGAMSLTNPEVEHDTIDEGSNLTDMISPAPQQIRFDAQMAAGAPSGLEYSWIDAASEITIDADVKLPLRGYVKNLTLRDTLDAALQIELYEQIERLELRMETVNGFPLSGDLQVFFLDSNAVVLDSLFAAETQVFAPAMVSMGQVVSSSTAVSTTDLDSARVANIQQMRKVLIQANMNSSNIDNLEIVTIDDQATFDVKIGAKIFGNVEW